MITGSGTIGAVTGSGGVRLISATGTLGVITGAALLMATAGIAVSGTIPKITGSGAIRTITASGMVPSVTGTGAGKIVATIQMGGTLSPVTGSGYSLRGAQIAATGTLSGISGAGRIVSTQRATSTVTLPAITGAGQVSPRLIITATGTLPALTAAGRITLVPTATFETWLLNVKTAGAAQYTNYGFTGLARHNNRYFGCNSSGIFELTGVNDAGTAIDATFTSGVSTAGDDNTKYFPEAHLELRCDGDAEFLLTTDPDGDAEAIVYDAARRIPLAKGARGKYVQIGFRNVAGSDFDLKKIVLKTIPTGRTR